MKANIAARATKDQVIANRSGIGYADSFASHRAHLTQEILARAPAGNAGRLCLLGAGNAHDVDLAALAARYGQIHLVDIDAEAVGRAKAAAPAAVRDRIHLHAPVDISGIWPLMDQWVREAGEGDHLAQEVGPAVARVVNALPGPFDVVVSCCMLTQLQLAVLAAVGDQHSAFDTFRGLTNAIHVRVLAALIKESGHALLFTDLTSDETYPLDSVEPGADLGKLMTDLVAAGNVIHTVHPGLLSAEIRRDPLLSAALNVRFPIGPWLWQNGPQRLFLVYGLEIDFKQAATKAAPNVKPAEPAHDTDDITSDITQIDDVIPRSYQDLVESQTSNLAWYFQKESARPELAFQRTYGGFFHMAYDISAPEPVGSSLYAILGPLLAIAADRAKIPVNALIRIRLGMFTQRELDVPSHNPHVDFYEPHMVGIYYVHDSDGDTVLFRETSDTVTAAQSAAYANAGLFTEAKRITPKKGRMIFFDGRRYHASMHPRAHENRIIINFDFR